MTASITLEELNSLIKEQKRFTLLDVRRKTDYEAAPETINSAPWHNPEAVQTWRREIPAEDLTIVYCVKGGPVSQSTAKTLEKNGLNARYLEGGLKAWTEQT